jgi:hypothetical protein
MKKIVRKLKLGEENPREDLVYWLNRAPEERIEAMEILRREWFGNSARLQRTARVIQSEPN